MFFWLSYIVLRESIMLTTSGRGTPQSNARTRADEDQKGIVLGRMVELNTSLVCLDISRMKLTDDDAAHLIRALDVNTTLKSVSAATAGLGRHSCRDFCRDSDGWPLLRTAVARGEPAA